MKTLKLALLFLLLSVALMAQSSHSVTLTWVDTLNPAGTTYTIYRAPGDCSAPIFTTLASGVAVMTYTDPNLVIGKYCYAVTAVNSGLESLSSNSAAAKVLPFSVVITVK